MKAKMGKLRFGILVALAVTGCDGSDDRAGTVTTSLTMAVAAGSDSDLLQCAEWRRTGRDHDEAPAEDGARLFWAVPSDGQLFCHEASDGVLSAWRMGARGEGATHRIVMRANNPARLTLAEQR